MLYQVLAIVVLAVFYAIYFTKMLLQKKRGIQTHQIGKRKEKNIHTVEMLMSIATLGAPIVQVLSILFNWSWLPDSARFTGFCVGAIGDVIFLMAVITMKNSWRAGIPQNDKTELVQDGIYRWSRNPAFLGFDFMYVGVCLMFCNPANIVFSLFAIIMLHLQILQEEKYLTATFGAPYAEYRNQVFRYAGRRNK
ncbi:MAG: isoprenylcysteine carboxylmethyltransferase family protein [Eubacteriales bacterium]|nr:isoprenylcysteine carboxylmethyltransferase family protein [Eubacteriales bacterium]MDD4513433.1 isoprenylcysteine carboxylmethyltransferase family protein [Eubacteriales bacterium]